MIASLHHLIAQHHLVLQQKGPYVVTVSSPSEGLILVKEMLYMLTDEKTTLFLSGGKTPKELYEVLGQEAKLSSGAVGLIDERYGAKMHKNSNEYMIEQTGLMNYFQKNRTPFYPILQKDIAIQSTALQYDETLRFLLGGFSKSVGILGIGIDGHTAGIPVEHSFDAKDKSLVTYFTDFPGESKQRISMTFLGLSMLDIMLVLVFGEDKKEALKKMVADGSEVDIPARFFKRPDIAQKTLIITDQIL